MDTNFKYDELSGSATNWGVVPSTPAQSPYEMLPTTGMQIRNNFPPAPFVPVNGAHFLPVDGNQVVQNHSQNYSGVPDQTVWQNQGLMTSPLVSNPPLCLCEACKPSNNQNQNPSYQGMEMQIQHNPPQASFVSVNSGHFLPVDGNQMIQNHSQNDFGVPDQAAWQNQSLMTSPLVSNPPLCLCEACKPSNNQNQNPSYQGMEMQIQHNPPQASFVSVNSGHFLPVDGNQMIQNHSQNDFGVPDQAAWQNQSLMTSPLVSNPPLCLCEACKPSNNQNQNPSYQGMEMQIQHNPPQATFVSVNSGHFLPVDGNQMIQNHSQNDSGVPDQAAWQNQNLMTSPLVSHPPLCLCEACKPSNNQNQNPSYQGMEMQIQHNPPQASFVSVNSGHFLPVDGNQMIQNHSQNDSGVPDQAAWQNQNLMTSPLVSHPPLCLCEACKPSNNQNQNPSYQGMEMQIQHNPPQASFVSVNSGHFLPVDGNQVIQNHSQNDSGVPDQAAWQNQSLMTSPLVSHPPLCLCEACKPSNNQNQNSSYQGTGNQEITYEQFLSSFNSLPQIEKERLLGIQPGTGIQNQDFLAITNTSQNTAGYISENIKTLPQSSINKRPPSQKNQASDKTNNSDRPHQKKYESVLKKYRMTDPGPEVSNDIVAKRDYLAELKNISPGILAAGGEKLVDHPRNNEIITYLAAIYSEFKWVEFSDENIVALASHYYGDMILRLIYKYYDQSPFFAKNTLHDAIETLLKHYSAISDKGEVAYLYQLCLIELEITKNIENMFQDIDDIPYVKKFYNGNYLASRTRTFINDANTGNILKNHVTPLLEAGFSPVQIMHTISYDWCNSGINHLLTKGRRLVNLGYHPIAIAYVIYQGKQRNFMQWWSDMEAMRSKYKGDISELQKLMIENSNRKKIKSIDIRSIIDAYRDTLIKNSTLSVAHRNLTDNK
ncbi:hypothetical protein [Paraburkholderia bonniea]|uniref:hypothetical protein n=1 Tax=Paraburkholderia bonniea TaxID=2152891 RepID=UPI001292A368|nr:hypothetical protein [Paraburkholderia bonniea]